MLNELGAAKALGVGVRRGLHALHLVADDGLEGGDLPHAGLKLRGLAVPLLPVERVGIARGHPGVPTGLEARNGRENAEKI